MIAKKIWLLCLVFLLSLFKLFSQNSTTFIPKTNVATSPEAALMTKFGDIPVSYYTGTPNISIPLYSIKEAGVEIPIVLEYNSSGIKVSEDATWVGLGWNLTPGGGIIAEVRGIKDSLDTNLFEGIADPTNYLQGFKNRFDILPMGLYKHLVQFGWEDYYNLCPDAEINDEPSVYRDPYSVIDALLHGKGQPDIYRYSFLGHSGNFFLNPQQNNQVVMLDQNESLKIEHYGGGFSATTADGTIFNFNENEVAYSVMPTDNFAGNTNKLNHISLINGGEINFQYENAHIKGRSYTQNASMNFACDNAPFNDQIPYVNYTYNNIKILKKISTDKIIIDFNLGERNDIMAGDVNKKLESIDITSVQSGKKIKSYIFSYSYFKPFPNSITYDELRLKLDSVTEVGYSYIDGVEVADYSKPAYKFSYKTDIKLPLKSSFSQDFWGYYNGAINSGLLPDLDFFEYNYQLQYQDPDPFYTNRNPFKYNYVKSNRYANNSYADAGILQKITYPSGGYTEFEYESNTFQTTISQFIPNNEDLLQCQKRPFLELNPNSCYNFQYITILPFGNSNVGTFTNGNNVVIKKLEGKFSISQDTKINIKNTFTHGNPSQNQNSSASYIIGLIYNNSRVELSKINGGTSTLIKTWYPSDYYDGVQNFENNIPSNSNEEEFWLYDSQPAEYKLSIYFPDDQYTNGFYNSCQEARVNTQLKFYDKDIIDRTVSKGGGLRIKSIKSYSSTGTLSSHKKYKYLNEDGITSSGKLLNRFLPLKASDVFCNNCGSGWVNNQTTASSVPFRLITVCADDFGMAGGTMIGYDRVEEIELATNTLSNESETINGKKAYWYYNFENTTEKGMFPIVNSLNGKLYKEQYFCKDNYVTPIQEKNYSYEYLTLPSSYDAITINNHFYGPDLAGNWDPEWGGSYKYSFDSYPLISQWYVLTKTIEKENTNGNEVSKTTNFIYDSYGNQKEIVTTNSKGELLKTKYYYPSDYFNNAAFESSMLNANMTGTPVAVEQYKSNELLSRKNTEGGMAYPSKIYSYKGGSLSTEEERVTIDYSEKGNIKQYILTNGQPVSFIYGYDKTVPIAKIEGRTYTSIAYSTITNLQSLSDDANTPEADLIDALNDLRTAYPDAMITTYTYKPGIGVSTITDPRGYTTTYEYDNFGRLKQVKDAEGNILSENEYHYRPQN